MNIFDAHISGALSVSASAEISENLLISGSLTVLGSITGSISGTITNADNAESASEAPRYTLSSSFNDFTSSYNTGSFTGSFEGSGLNLYNIPASGITGLNLSQIADGTATASISQANGFNVNTNINISGSILPSVHVGDNVSEYSLGSPTNAWHHLYISTGSIKFVDDLGLEQGRITINPNSGQFNILSTSGLTESEIAQIESGNIPSSSLTDINIKSLNVNQNIFASGSVTSSVFTGSFIGDGTSLYNIPASGVTGLNLTQIADGSATASISNTNGLRVNSNTEITGSLNLNNLSLGVDTVISNTVTDSAGKYYINGIKNPVLTFIKGFKYRFYNPNNGTHPILFSTTNDGEHNGGVAYTVGVTENVSPYYIEIEVTKDTPTTLYYYCDHHVGMGNSISITNDVLNNVASNNIIYVDPTRIATTGSNTFVGAQNVSGSVNLTGSLNITGSISLNGVPVGTGKLDETTFNSYTSSNDLTSSTQNDRLTSLETSTGSINTTIKNKLDTESVISGSIQVQITGTTGYSTFSSSVATTTIDLKNKVDSIETSTGSLNSFTSSINTTIKDKMNADGVLSGSITFDISVIPGFTGLTNTVSSSISSSVSELSGSLTVTVTNLSSSLTNTDENQNNRIIGLETASGSLNSFTSSINTTIKSKLNTEGVISGSVQVNLTSTTGYSTFSSSIATTDLNQNNRLDSIEGKTGSYATTGSNRFNGNQTITGSLTITQNLTVLGSSSIVYATSSQLMVEDNIIVVNASTPAERFAGLQVYDSGSNGSITASLFWDGLNNRWIYQNSSEAHYGGAMFIAGPRNTGSLGDEITLTNGKLPKSIGGDHIGDSIMNETDGVIYVTGSLSATGTVYGSNITAIETSTGSLNTFTSSFLTAVELTGSNLTIKGNLLVKGTTTNVNTTTLDVDNNLINLNGTGATSAGLRVKDTTGPNQVSGSLLWDATNDYWVAGQLGSEQRLVRETEFNNAVTRIGGVEISTGSLNSFTSSINTTIKSKLNTEGVISGSAQVSGLSNSQLTNSSITIGSTSTSLGGTSTSLAGLTSVTSTAFTGSIQGYATSETLSTVTGRGSSTSNALTINYSTGGLNLNRPATSNYVGLYYQTAGSSKWFIGLRENLTSNNYICYSETLGADVLTLNQTTGVATFGYNMTAANFSGSSSGTNTGDETLARINALAITAVGTITGGTWNGSSIGTTYTAAKVTAVNAGTGVGVDTTTGSVTVSIGQSVATTATPTFATLTTTSGTQNAYLNYNTAAGVVALKSDVATAGTYTISVGKATTTNNTANFRYNHAGGDGSTSNFVGIGFWGNDDLFKVYATGNAILSGNLRTAGSTSNVVKYLSGASTVTFGNSLGGSSTDGSRTVFFRGTTSTASVWWGGPDSNGDNIPHGAIDSVSTGGLTFWYNTAGVGGGTWNKVMSIDSGGITANAGNFVGNVTGNVSGTAGGETLATVTARGTTTSAALTLSSSALTMSSHYYTLMYSTNETYVHFYPSGGNGSNYSAVNWRFWTTAGGTKVLRAGGDGTFTWDSSVVKTVANSSYSTTFSSVTSVTVTHSLGTKDVAVFVYDSSDNMFWPSSIVTTSTSVVTITFASSRSGRVVVVR